MKKCDSDENLFMKYNEDGTKPILAMGVWVDDMVIVCKRDSTFLGKLKSGLNQKYKVEDKGVISEFLGIKVTRGKDTIKIDQSDYVTTVLKRFNMEDCKVAPTPDVKGKKLSPRTNEEKKSNSAMYQSAIGCLLYVMVCTRPDISFAVCNAARFMHDPSVGHWESVRRIFRYLRGTINKGIVFKKIGTKQINLTLEVDASWASNDITTWRSDTGYIAFVNGAPISWKCTRQKTIAQSSTEAEYMGACAAVKEAIWFRKLLFDLRLLKQEPTVIYEDNRGCIALSTNPVNHERNKHINVKYHLIRQAAENKQIVLVYKSTEDITADLLTKPMDSTNFKKCANKLTGD